MGFGGEKRKRGLAAVDRILALSVCLVFSFDPFPSPLPLPLQQR